VRADLRPRGSRIIQLENRSPHIPRAVKSGPSSGNATGPRLQVAHLRVARKPGCPTPSAGSAVRCQERTPPPPVFPTVGLTVARLQLGQKVCFATPERRASSPMDIPPLTGETADVPGREVIRSHHHGVTLNDDTCCGELLATCRQEMASPLAQRDAKGDGVGLVARVRLLRSEGLPAASATYRSHSGAAIVRDVAAGVHHLAQPDRSNPAERSGREAPCHRCR